MLAISDKITYMEVNKIWSHILYSLDSIVGFVLVLVVTSYTEKFEKGRKVIITIFLKQTFPLFIMTGVTKISDRIRIEFEFEC